MSGGWQVGDLALCVDASLRSYPRMVLKKGKIYRVQSVALARCGETGLFLGEVNSVAPYGFAAERFRKIKPDTEGANADDAAWLKDLLAKPRVSA
ncbi:MAG: hypothetical protein V4657_09375 [Pseudomonadota bacterium]